MWRSWTQCRRARVEVEGVEVVDALVVHGREGEVHRAVQVEVAGVKRTAFSPA